MKQNNHGIPILIQLMGICLVMTAVVVCGIHFYLLPLFETELLKNEKHHSHDLVQSVHSLVDEYYRRAQNNEFDEKEAQLRALQRISKMRYGDNGYFWVNDMNAKMLMHPIQTELNGKDLSAFKDAKGTLLFMEFVRVCKKDGSGTVDYWWPEPGVSGPVEKTSYVKLFVPWNWVIGSGLYKAEMQRSIVQLHHDLHVGTAAIIAVLVIINIIIALRIARPLNRLSAFSVKLKEDLSLRAPLEGSMEVQQLAMTLNNTTEQLAVTLVSRDRLDAALKSMTDMQVQLIHQEKMASIGQLAAGVAHEINNPMGFITSNLSTMEKYVARMTEYLMAADRLITNSAVAEKEELALLRSRLKLDYIINDTLQLIEESLDGATRVKHIVNDLKNLSRTDQAEPVYADLNRCLESSLNIACNEIKYVADIDLQLGVIPEILCHPQQLSQVLINLLINAGQAIEGHGIITVRTWSENDDVFVAVTDTGKGIPVEIQQRIFEPFFTTKDVGKGTGLGLSISYEIIQKHGGEIKVESEVGRGTTFIVRLPVDGPPQVAAD